MQDELPPGVELPVTPHTVARGYETDDVDSRIVYSLVSGVVLLIAVLCGGLWWLHEQLVNRRTVLDATRSVVTPPAVVNRDAPPLQPQVGHESLDAWDLKKMHDREDKVFADLGWAMDDRTHRHRVPAALVEAVRDRPAATRPATRPEQGGR